MDSYQGQGRHTGPSTCQVTMFIHFMGSDQISQIHVLLCIPLFMFCSRAVASTNTSHQRPLSHRPGSHAHPSPLPPGYYVQSHQRAQPTPCLSAGNDSCSPALVSCVPSLSASLGSVRIWESARILLTPGVFAGSDVSTEHLRSVSWFHTWNCQLHPQRYQSTHVCHADGAWGP